MGLARQIALPHEYAPERFPSFPALERTAVMAFCQPTTLTLPASTSVKILLARQATYPLWADYDPGVFSYSVSYGCDSVAGTPSETNSANVVGAIAYSSGNTTASGSLVGVSGSVAALPYPIVGVDGSQVPFIWAPAGSTVVVSISRTANTGGTTYQVFMKTWSSPGQYSFLTQNITVVAGNRSNGASFVSSGQWICPVSFTQTNDASGIQAAGTNVVALTVVRGLTSVTGSVSNLPTVIVATGVQPVQFLPLTSPAEFANSQLPWFATRTTAAAMLGSNVSQVLNKAGTILGGRVSPNVIDPFSVTQSYVNTLHPAEKAWLPLETGVYTYCPPSTDLSNFWDYTLHLMGGAFAPIPVYRLDNDALVNVAFVTAGSVAESLAVTLDWHIEFRTSSALFQIGLSSLPLEVLHQAQLSLTQAGYFFENPEHKSVLQKVTAAVKRFAPHLMTAAGAAFPQFAGALNAARRLIIPQPKAMKMTATSATSSGIVSKKVVVSRSGAKKKSTRPRDKKGKR